MPSPPDIWQQLCGFPTPVVGKPTTSPIPVRTARGFDHRHRTVGQEQRREPQLTLEAHLAVLLVVVVLERARRAGHAGRPAHEPRPRPRPRWSRGLRRPPPTPIGSRQHDGRRSSCCGKRHGPSRLRLGEKLRPDSCWSLRLWRLQGPGLRRPRPSAAIRRLVVAVESNSRRSRGAC